MPKRYLLLVLAVATDKACMFGRFEADQVIVTDHPESVEVETLGAAGDPLITFHAIKDVPHTYILPNASSCIIVYDRQGMQTNLYPPGY